MSTARTERFRVTPTLLGYMLVGAAAPWLIVIGEVQGGMDGVGVASAIVVAIVAAVGLSFFCRRFSVHLVGALTAWLGWSVSGGMLVGVLFSNYGPNLPGSMLLLGWIGLWTALPCAFVINGATAVIVHFARPRARNLLQCVRCDYDLRGLAHGRCPECGTVAERAGA